MRDKSWMSLFSDAARSRFIKEVAHILIADDVCKKFGEWLFRTESKPVEAFEECVAVHLEVRRDRGVLDLDAIQSAIGIQQPARLT
jgi:hypothetical protein